LISLQAVINAPVRSQLHQRSTSQKIRTAMAKWLERILPMAAGQKVARKLTQGSGHKPLMTAEHQAARRSDWWKRENHFPEYDQDLFFKWQQVFRSRLTELI
jgi:hypothetical protein